MGSFRYSDKESLGGNPKGSLCNSNGFRGIDTSFTKVGVSSDMLTDVRLEGIENERWFGGERTEPI